MSKLKLVAATGALLMVAAVGFSALEGATGRSDDNYLLSSQWTPSVLPKHHCVWIAVWVDGLPLPRKEKCLSPWTETMTAEPGVVVKMTADVRNPNVEKLDCIIMRNGNTIPRTGFDSIAGPGIVTCSA